MARLGRVPGSAERATGKRIAIDFTGGDAATSDKSAKSRPHAFDSVTWRVITVGQSAYHDTTFFVRAVARHGGGHERT